MSMIVLWLGKILTHSLWAAPVFLSGNSKIANNTLIIGIILAGLTGVLVPVLLRWWDRSRKQKDKQDTKQEQTARELNQASKQLLEERLKTYRKQIKELEEGAKSCKEAYVADLTKLREKLEKVDRSLLKRFGECQSHFVTMEAYKKDLGVQRYYYKLIYSMLQKQTSMGDDGDDGGGFSPQLLVGDDE